MIPARLHFIWFGPRLPWFVRLSMESALKACPGAEVCLWSEQDLTQDRELAALIGHPRLRVSQLGERSLFEGAQYPVPSGFLRDLLGSLRQPAARANVVRLLVLARFGGVYLDTDTLTLRDLTPLLSLDAFCGEEHVVWPEQHARGFSRYHLWGGPTREVLRFLCAHLPRGERAFERVSQRYATAANNAVLGFAPQHPFVEQLLHALRHIAPAERTRRYRLGTHLLQEQLKSAAAAQVKRLGPQHFYPLGPEISRQYFRVRGDAARAADRLLAQPTYVLHWYGSLSQLSGYDEPRVRRESSIFAELARRVLDTQHALASASAEVA